MGYLYSTAKILARIFLPEIKNLFIANWFKLPFIALLLFGSFTAGASTSFAQVCVSSAVGKFNTNLAVAGRGQKDVLEFNFANASSVTCRTRFGNAIGADANRTEISHCNNTNPENLCFVANIDANLTSLELSGPGLAGGFTVGDNVQVDLLAGVYNAVATVSSIPVSFTFTIEDQSSDPNDQRLANSAISFTPMFPTLSIANTTDGTEPGTDGLLTVTQTATSVTDTIISYSVAGTATAGTDYTALSGTVTVLAGDTTATIPVPVLDDGEVEGNETVIVTLTAVTSGLPTLGAPLEATNTIGDDDAATVTITGDATASESTANGSFTVNLSTKSPTDTVVSYTVGGSATDGSDYSGLASGNITIAADDTSATIPFNILDDAIVESAEEIVVTLGAVTPGATAILSTVPDEIKATYTITDDDGIATVSIASTTDASEAGAAGSFTIELTAASATLTEVFYEVDGATTAGVDTDYNLFSGGFKIPVIGSLSIPAGDTSVIIKVVATSDAIAEGDEEVIIRLTSVSSASGTAALSTVPGEGSATSTIVDAVTDATISIANEEDAEEAGSDGTFTVTQSETSSSITEISYTVSGTATAGVDYKALSGSVEIPAGQKTATILVSVINDVVVEGDETVIITLTEVTRGSAKLDVSVSATNTIVDDDADINKRVAQAFQGQVHNYVSRRMKLQSRSSPSIHRNPNSGTSTNKNLNGNIDLSGNESGTSGSFSFTNSFDVAGVGCENCNNPYFWAEAEFAYFRDKGPATQSSGNYYIGYAGLSLPVDKRLTVGVMGQVDRFEDNLDSNLGQVSGTGWAIGPYFSAKVLDELNLDVRGLWGRSNNKAIQSVLGTEFSGSFDTERWIVEGILSGRHSVDEYSFVPSARIFYMNENWDDYTVSDGNRAVSINGDSAEIGNLSAALEIIKTVKSSDYTVETFVSGEIYWDFQDPGIIDSTGVYTENDDFSASISAGIGIDNENSSLRLEATYSGFGDDSLESLAGTISLSHKF